MKIAIQGHPTKGKEVIQILKSLGGKTAFTVYGFDERYCYYINPNGIIIEYLITIRTKDEFKLYTLEEFETQFPFKIGDIILLKGVNKPYKIIALELYMNRLCYKLDNGLHYDPETLTIYEKMKEERNITLTLEKAKEWYNKGGELKEVALQAFSEKELTKVELPKTWKEFCENYPVQVGETIIDGQTSEIRRYYDVAARSLTQDKNICPSKKSAEAHLALIQLEQLRDCWRQGWKPEWNASHKYAIINLQGEITVLGCSNVATFLAFPTREMAEEFLKCFRDLIELARDLI